MRLASMLCFLVVVTSSAWSQGQDGFTNELVAGSFEAAVGVAFATDGRAVVWEKPGRVWTVVDGVVDSTPLLDISDEIANYGDYGLVGLALDPGFLSNGHFYLLYAVDHHHLESFGTSEYEPTTNDYYRATIGRLTRYTAETSSNFHTVDPASRTVLIGDSLTTGIPLMAQSHGPGSLVFGADGTLLMSCGDAASSQVVDTGGDAQGTYTLQGLAEGILRGKENVGAYRAQLVDSMCGKILRVDPATGDGVASNPYFQSSVPNSAQSRVWALGFRQPYRMTLKPGTGSSDPADANPGTLYIGDVGWANWEELSVCTTAGQNFGWPIYEGLETHPAYSSAAPINSDAPNPLSCATSFAFDDLLIQETTAPDPWFPNPCDSGQEIPSTVPHFVHTRPILEWNHSTGMARTGTFSGSTATTAMVGAPGSPVQGATFGGGCSTGGCWYTGSLYPLAYRDRYYHGDFTGNWLRTVTIDAFDRPTLVIPFLDAISVVSIAQHPIDEMLYYISYTSELRRVAYSPCGNQPPLAVVETDQYFGPGPLTVQFSGAQSSDPEGDALSYEWNFGDGATSTAMDPTHVFTAPTGVPTRFDVTLTVVDAFGSAATTTQIVSVNNTPPVITILSPVDGTLYPVTGDAVFPCEADVVDAEHDASELVCGWQTVLHHETHSHPDLVDGNCSTTTVTSPVGCGDEVYFFRVHLTVTDAAGLSTTETVTLLPDCSGSPLGVLHVEVDPHDATVAVGESLDFTVVVGNGGAVDLTDIDVTATCDVLAFAGGDVNANGIMETTEEWTYVCTIDSVAASFTQIVTATAMSASGSIAETHTGQITVVPANARVTDGQLAVYTFDEGAGTTVADVSGQIPALDLQIADVGAVTWLSGGGVSVDSSTVIASPSPATVLTDRLQMTQEMTIEAWIRPANTSQFGPARIVALSVDGFPVGGNFVFGQSTTSYDLRLRTTETNDFGLPGLSIPSGTATTDLTHVVITRSVCSGMRYYQDGVLILEDVAEGDLAGWEDGAILALANEPTADRPWLGELHLVAIFDRGLSLTEVEQNFAAGPNGLLVGPPTIDSPPSPITVCEGGDVLLEVVASGAGLVMYQWRRDGVELPGEISASLEIFGVATFDQASYDVVVSNLVGSVISPPAFVSVESAATITAPPIAQTVCETEPVSFSVAATGTISGYQWRLGGVPIPGAVSETYTIAAVSPADVGEYTVEVLGSCGSLLSVGAALDLSPPGVCLPNFVRGDCDASGTWTITDPIALLSYLFQVFALDCDDACDVNDDGALDIADALYSLSALFGGGPAPAAPFPMCGVDSSADFLDCGSFSVCP